MGCCRHGHEPGKLRVVTRTRRRVGMKTPVYPNIRALVAAKELGRPVHWMASRAESFLTDNQARDMFADGELALDENGKFLALRLSCVVISAPMWARSACISPPTISRAARGHVPDSRYRT